MEQLMLVRHPLRLFTEENNMAPAQRFKKVRTKKKPAL